MSVDRPERVFTHSRLTNRALALYALPALPLAALTLPLYVLVPNFYTGTLGVPLAAAGAALLLVRLFDAINDPLIGWAADRFRPRFGRRRMAFALGLPIAALAALLLFAPPAEAGVLWLTFSGLLLSLGYTMALIPYSAWGAELAGDYNGRARLSAWREGFTLVGTLLAIALPFAIGMDNGEGWHGLAVLGVAIALLLPLFGGIALAFTPEPTEYSRTRLSLRSGLANLALNAPFKRLLVAYFLNGIANGLPATLFLFFVGNRLGLAEAQGGLLFLYFLCGVAGVPLAALASRRFGKHRAWCGAMLLACLAFAPAPLLPAGSLTAFAVICVLTGLLLGFDLVIPPAIQADVIDVDTARSGEQRSGIYFAAWSLATKLALALAAGVVLPMLAFFGFDPAPGASSLPEGMTALAIAYAWVPIGFKLVSIALMWNFPLDEKSQETLRASIEASR